MTFWQRLLAWLGLSEPGDRKEQVEDWIAANGPKLDAMRDRQAARRAAKGHFFQRLRGWLRPSDQDDDPENDFTGLPVWCALSIDIYEQPVTRQPRTTSKGWRLNIYVTEVDATEWRLTIDSDEGSLGWVQTLPLAVP